ncbi:MAG: RNA 2',3'-cyclic phosphodiesterase [Pseudomonadota bacterium]
MIRAFVALTLPDPMIEALDALQADLTIGSLVARENLHLTLAFLGEQPRPVLEDLHLALERIRLAPFELTLSGLGQFGGREPRTIHAEADRTEPLKRLRGKVYRAAEEAGLTPDTRRFHPHVTLSRLKALDFEERAGLERWTARHAGFAAGPSEMSSFGLYQSTLTRNGPVYDLMAAYPLG